MPKRNGSVPAYRLHKPSGLARAIINQEHIYLGKYGSAQSRERYARLLAELVASGGRAPATPKDVRHKSTISVAKLILAYLRFAECQYVKDGKTTGTLLEIRASLRPVDQLYGLTAADEFGPKSLKDVRQHMVESGLSRKVINHRVGRIKRMFKWAVAEELVPPSVYHGLQAVGGLAFGRTAARETEPIRPVPDLYVAAVLPFVTPHVAAMIKVQRLSGMRPGELVIMRP